MHRVYRFRNAGNVIKNVKDALGPCGCFLRKRYHAAHRIEPQVETADIGEKSGEYANRNLILRYLPDTEKPYHEEPDFGKQCHRWREQRPDLIDAVVNFQVAVVCHAKTHGLAFLLRKGLDNAHAGNGVGKHAGNLGPDAINLLESRAQSVAYQVDEPCDDRQG